MDALKSFSDGHRQVSDHHYGVFCQLSSIFSIRRLTTDFVVKVEVRDWLRHGSIERFVSSLIHRLREVTMLRSLTDRLASLVRCAMEESLDFFPSPCDWGCLKKHQLIVVRAFVDERAKTVEEIIDFCGRTFKRYEAINQLAPILVVCKTVHHLLEYRIQFVNFLLGLKRISSKGGELIWLSLPGCFVILARSLVPAQK